MRARLISSSGVPAWRDGCYWLLLPRFWGAGTGAAEARGAGDKAVLSLEAPAPGVLRQRVPVRSLRLYR
jgi:hypothetical protein